MAANTQMLLLLVTLRCCWSNDGKGISFGLKKFLIRHLNFQGSVLWNSWQVKQKWKN